MCTPRTPKQVAVPLAQGLGDLLDLGVEAGLVEKSGAWYSYGEERIGQGRENARRFLLENRDIFEQLEDAVYAHHGLKRSVPAYAVPPSEAESEHGTTTNA